MNVSVHVSEMPPKYFSGSTGTAASLITMIHRARRYAQRLAKNSSTSTAPTFVGPPSVSVYIVRYSGTVGSEPNAAVVVITEWTQAVGLQDWKARG